MLFSPVLQCFQSWQEQLAHEKIALTKQYEQHIEAMASDFQHRIQASTVYDVLHGESPYCVAISLCTQLLLLAIICTEL